MITFLCYLALCIFLFLVQFGPPFLGTPINEEKGTRILFAITKKINTWLFDYGFAVFSHRCRFELHSVYLMNLRRFTTSHAKLPFNTNTQTDKPVIPFWWGFFLCRKLIRWYWYSDQKNPRSWCKPSDTETYNALPTLPGIQRSE